MELHGMGGGGGGGGGVDWGSGEGGCHVSMWKNFQISAKTGGWVLQMVQTKNFTVGSVNVFLLVRKRKILSINSKLKMKLETRMKQSNIGDKFADSHQRLEGSAIQYFIYCGQV